MFKVIFQIFILLLISVSYAQNNVDLNQPPSPEIIQNLISPKQVEEGTYNQEEQKEGIKKEEEEKQIFLKNLPQEEKGEETEVKKIPENIILYPKNEPKILEPLEEEPLSFLEELYQEKIKSVNPEFEEKISQFGYKFFQKEKIEYPSVSVGSNYVLGPGDVLIIYLWGDPVDILQLENYFVVEVDREGKVFIPGIGVFYISGLSVNAFKNVLKKALSKKFKNFELEVSLGKLREFPVYVAGFVNSPGSVMITSVNNIQDVLVLAKGVSKNGSLRNITITHIDGSKTYIDLYDLLVYGKPLNVKVKDGDTVYVSPIGKTAAVFGMVKRPGIYELKNEKSLQNVLNLTGGLLPSSYKYGVKIYRNENGKIKITESILNKDVLSNFEVKDGDVVYIEKISNFVENKIKVEGHVLYPGLYDVEKYSSLKQLIKTVKLYPDTNVYYGEIERVKDDGSKEYLTFKPIDIQNGKIDITLRPQDVIRFYKFGDVKSIDFNKIKNAVVLKGHIRYEGAYAYEEGLKLSDVLTEDHFKVDTDVNYGEILRKSYPDLNYKILTFRPINIIAGKSDIRLQPMDEIVFFPKWIYKPVEISGEIENKKIVPFYEGITLLDVLRNVKFREKVRNLKVIVYSGEGKTKKQTVYLYDLLIKGDKTVNIPLSPGDKLIVKKTEATEKDKTVRIFGEVKKPGIYKYKSGMRLYDLIKMAGGYTEDAYPKALIFIRESAKRLQREQLEASLLAMEESIAESQEGLSAAGASPQEREVIKLTLAKQKKLFSILKKKAEIGLGRIALDIPESLEELKSSEDNIHLQDGDYIFIPPKPNYVLVLGGVYNQISLPYKKEWRVIDYINEVGGLKENANEKEIYIIKANGRVISKQNTDSMFKYISWKNNKLVFGRDFYNMHLEEGDTIVVPTKVKIPILWRPLIKDVTQIIFQAISTAVLAKRL